MKSWTVMVFLAGDNDLEDAAHADLFEMLKVGSSDQVDVVVQLDSRQDGAVRYHVQPHALQPASEPLAETNTGDPAVLTDFIRWARETYPARHTLLVIWNHGTGWEDVPADFNWQRIRGSNTQELKQAMFASTVREAYAYLSGARAIALDATSRDFLDNRELQQGLVEALAGEKLDIIGFDACLMGMVEIGYQLRRQARFMVASQEVEPHYGWPYEAILQTLHQQPDMSPREVSRLIVNSYGQMGVQMRAATKYTQSAFDLAQIETTFMLAQQLASRLLAGYPDQLKVRQAVHEASGARRGAKRFRDGNNVDLYDWCWRMQRVYTGPDAELKATLETLLAHLTPEAESGLVVANAAEVGDDREQVHGASLYLPQRKKYTELYASLDFAQTGWAEFAQKVSETIT